VQATAEVYLYGAHVTSWTVGGKDLIFVSKEAIFKPPKAIRGGIPVCWPAFSDFKSDSFKGLASHGFARNSTFELQESTPESATLVLDGSSQMGPEGPSCKLQIKVTLQPTKLLQEMTVANEGSTAFEFTAALHSYFRVADITQTRLEGLGEGQQPYLDNMDKRSRKESAGTLTVDQEVDRIYLQASPEVTVVDGAGGHSLQVARSGFPDVVVWNPWVDKSKATGDFGDEEYKEMLCVEVAIAPSGPAKVEGGATWQASQTLSYTQS